MVHVIKKGLNVPISGAPEQTIDQNEKAVTSVGLIADDYHGMRPTMLVKEGDKVKLGQPLFEDKKNEGVLFTSPGSGVVRSINRGDKRKFLSIIIDLEGDEEETFPQFDSFQGIGGHAVTENLLKSGLWTAFRTRPYSKTPVPFTVPRAIFVNAMDTNPLASEPELVIDRNREHFVNGLSVLSNLLEAPQATSENAEGEKTSSSANHEAKIYLCTRTESRVPGGDMEKVQHEQFKGPHPAGLPGTHIHLVDPVNQNKTVWTIGYQDVIAIGHLFATGRLMTSRVISLAGPVVKKPRLIQTRVGACLDDIVAGELSSDHVRVISGSVLAGDKSEQNLNYLGRYHNQVSVIEEGDHREFMGWQKPGVEKFTVTRLYVGALLKKTFNMTSNLNGSYRSMVPIETYERVMPLDILPTQLLRALISKDTEDAQALGCLELDEEDLALCTFVCPGKYEYGSILRDNLTVIEKEG